MSLEHLWAGWRREYIVEATDRERAGGRADDDTDCVFCRLAASGEPSEDNLVVWRGDRTFVVMNAYPYASRPRPGAAPAPRRLAGRAHAR